MLGLKSYRESPSTDIPRHYTITQIRRQRDRHETRETDTKQRVGMRTIQKRSSDRKTIVEILLVAKNGIKNEDTEGERQYVCLGIRVQSELLCFACWTSM